MTAKRTSRSARKAGPAKSSAKRKQDVLAVARARFGFSELRPGQEQAIRSLLSKRDTLAVMPTGAGKSAIYQIAGLMTDGTVLVVSPLIALQKDQVDAINDASHGKVEAIVINSTLKAAEFRESLARVAEQCCKFVFLAPEQLSKAETTEALHKAGISLIAIDEAHCISEWGHDFRPDYLQLGRVIEQLGHPPTVAMTATASERVRNEIVERLDLKKAQVIVTGFDRPNIYLRVDHFDEEAKKLEALLHRVRWADKPGIVYSATRKDAEAIQASLQEDNVSALVYHGGMKAEDRHRIQDQFMSGEAEVIVATNAFGMGIDKADIRFVYHFNVPDSLDSYYQEIGRSGRDGKRAEAVLFFRQEDIGAVAFHTCSGKENLKQLDQVAEAIAAQDQPVTAEEIGKEMDLSPRKVRSSIQKLADAGAIEILPDGEVQLASEADLEQAAQTVAEQQEERQDGSKQRLEQMREYVGISGCRREYLLSYFGDTFTGPCNHCDNCEAERPAIQVDAGVGTRREVA